MLQGGGEQEKPLVTELLMGGFMTKDRLELGVGHRRDQAPGDDDLATLASDAHREDLVGRKEDHIMVPPHPVLSEASLHLEVPAG